MITKKQIEAIDGDMVTVSKKDLLALLDRAYGKKKKDVDLSAVSPHLMPVVQEWLAYKRERQESYKQRGFDTFYRHFVEMCGNDALTAKAIVDQSMMNNWSGVFPLKGEIKKTSYPSSMDEVRDEDICPSIEFFFGWTEKNCQRLETLDDWPSTADEFRKMTAITVGGTRGMAYALLVLNRDGYEKYVKDNSLKWAYYNFIKANGLFAGKQ